MARLHLEFDFHVVNSNQGCTTTSEMPPSEYKKISDETLYFPY